MIKVCAYIRKSPDDKESTESSLNNQIKMIKEKTKEMEWSLKEEDIFCDKNITGSDRKRKDFNRMLDLVRTNREYNIIVVKDQDRFCRDSAFFQDTLTNLDAYGIKIFSIIKNKFLSQNDIGDVIMSVVNARNVIDGRILSRDIYERKRKEGLPPSIAPFGYYNDYRIKDGNRVPTGKWEIDKKESLIVKQVCNDYLNKVPLNNTIQNLKINKPLYYRILKNAKNGIYNSFIYYINKYRDSNKVIIRKEEVKYKGIHENILDQETYEELQNAKRN